ncbi:Membrane protein [Helicobacter bizzozeronii CCUG 35545]|uniref:PTS sugar transporter subunit IIC n=1 Tax=Helicobacter bizzozeronii TaxID=56877 RepID=UPI00024E5BC8|nr:PTS sugar transporter subunit IIC [Helicobacter bizzozeronii]CCF80401.1 Membrane protein [Helicobacter bizzozeronii CCUG 35545]
MKDFLLKLLSGMAIAVVIALAPNAILGGLLKPYAHIHAIGLFADALVILQALLSLITGVLVGLNFNFNPLKSSIIGAAAFIASGVVKHTPNGLVLAGVGDLLTVLIVVALAVKITQWLGDKFGSLTIILQPIAVGVFCGFLGLFILPYTTGVTLQIGQAIMYFTQLHPLLMCVLISISYAFIIISPISTVAVSLIIGISGLASGAANMGVVSTTAVLIVGSLLAKNKAGVSVAILLGAMKMMIPNFFKSPIMATCVFANGVLAGLITYFFQITGDAKSAGFGLVGLIGPIKAYEEALLNQLDLPLMRVVLTYGVLPFVGAIILHFLCCKLFRAYQHRIYYFQQAA